MKYDYQLTHWFKEEADLSLVIQDLDRNKYEYKVVEKNKKFAIFTPGTKKFPSSHGGNIDLAINKKFNDSKGIGQQRVVR